MRKLWDYIKEHRDYLQKAVNVAWPAVVESFFVALVGLIDSFMVSRVGAYAVAAVGLTTQPKFIGLAVFIAINTSVSALVARRRGENRREDANRILVTAIACVLVLTVVVSVLCVALADPIIHLVGSAEDTHDYAVAYFRIIMGGIGFSVLSLVINAAQRGSGNTRVAMITNLASNLVNVIFNYLLIGGNFGFPALGVTGAAIATVIGTVVACGLSIASLFRKDSYVSIPYMLQQKLGLCKSAFGSILNFAPNVFVEQIMMRIGFLLTATLAANLGTQAMAAHQVGMNVMSISFSFGDGLQVAAVTLIGQSLGAGEPQKAKQFGNLCQGIGLCFSLILAVFYLTMGRWLYVLFFPSDPDIVEIGVRIMLYMVPIVLCQVSQVIFTGSLRGAGDVRFTTIASTISVTIIRPSVSYLLAYPLGLGISGIWLGVLADQATRLAFAGLRFRSGKWLTKKI